MLNGLDLFSGIGGISIAISPWVRTIAYCESDRYAQSVLLSRMSEGKLHLAPIWDDIRTLRGERAFHNCQPIDIIFGGFPCQDISVAGNGAGLEGSRSGLFFEIIRLTRELRPRFVFLENVPAITFRGLDRVLLEFTALGYDCRWTIVSAAEMGAPHLRERWFLLAHANGIEFRNQQEPKPKCSVSPIFGNHGEKKSMANPASKGLEGRLDTEAAWAALKLGGGGGGGTWAPGIPEPAIRRGSNGLQNRVDRLRAMGNSVVPAQAKEAFERLMGLK